MALTPAEKLQVISSPLASFLRTVQANYLPPGRTRARASLADLDVETGRGSDFRLIAQAAFVLQRYDGTGRGIKSAGTISQVERWLSTTTIVRPSFRDSIENTFATFVRVLDDERAKKRADLESRVAPIEFVFIVLLIFVCGGSKMPLDELSEKIGDMRRAVRKAHKDVRMNNFVAATFFEFIGKVKSKGASRSGKRKLEDEEPSDRSTKRPTPPRQRVTGAYPDRLEHLQVVKPLAVGTGFVSTGILSPVSTPRQGVPAEWKD